MSPPCLPNLVLYEDGDLLVVNKPAGMNTHAPAPYAGEGLFEWLRHREPGWAGLSIVHRLDKQTSGVLLFSKTSRANRSLVEQFTCHKVQKQYLFLTDRPVPEDRFEVTSSLVRAGARYLSRPVHAGSAAATTRFRLRESKGKCALVEAEPLTGRTHQIRVHAAQVGLPILGDDLYGGGAGRRLCLHAARVELRHPADGRQLRFTVPVDFEAEVGLALRNAVIDSEETDAYRVIHGASDGWAGWYVDRLGSLWLSQSESGCGETERDRLKALLGHVSNAPPEGAADLDTGRAITPVAGAGSPAVYHKILDRQVRRLDPSAACPRHWFGALTPGPQVVRENGLSFEVSVQEGYSVGLFLDQRDNRRRLLKQHVAASFPVLATPKAGPRLLNTFAYTCAFSVCAARAGMHTTSLDLSRKYLDWGRRNFGLNGLDASGHDFIYGDVFQWLKRLARKERRFDVILLDPPAFSQSKESGVFRAERDYPALVEAAVALLEPDGVIFASTNLARYAPEAFLADVRGAIEASGRKTMQEHYVPQPPDFPISPGEPAYLKTVWLRVA
jgi:23S rRNA (cytosine1962-C5)-methyltransferase